MALTALIAITLASIVWSLWIRRLTWRCRWEVAATLNIALQGLAVVLMSPFASATLGVWLHSLTGEWNVEDWIGHDCYIVAASSIVYHAIGRLEDGSEFRRKFRRDVEIPATICIPLALAAFTWGVGSREYRADFFRVPADNWLAVYWIIVCGMIGYLLAYSTQALLILRDDPRSRQVANIYLFAAAAGIIAAVCRITVSFLPATWQDTLPASLSVWITASTCGAGFALTSAWSWHQKTRWFTDRPGWNGLHFDPQPPPTPKPTFRYEPRVDRPAF